MDKKQKDTKGLNPIKEQILKNSEVAQESLSGLNLKSIKSSQLALSKIHRNAISTTTPALTSISQIVKNFDFDSHFNVAKSFQTDFLKDTSYLRLSESIANSHRMMIPDNLTSSSITNFKHLFEPVHFIQPSVFNDFRKIIEPQISSVHFSQVMQRAFEPPPNIGLFSDTIKKWLEPDFGFPNYGQVMAQAFSNPIPEIKLYGDIWTQFNKQMEFDWEPVLKISARVAGLTALQQFPNYSDDDLGANEQVEKNGDLISLDEARDSIFAAIEIDGKTPPQQMQHAFRFLWSLETEMRRFIQNVMISQFGPNWEKSRLPAPMYSNWLEKKNKSLKQGRSSEIALIEFADFTDYVQLIVSSTNWGIFEPFFRHKNIAEASFQRLFPYRLDTMHARTVPKEDLLIIAGDCQWLLKCLNVSLIEPSGSED